MTNRKQNGIFQDHDLLINKLNSNKGKKLKMRPPSRFKMISTEHKIYNYQLWKSFVNFLHEPSWLKHLSPYLQELSSAEQFISMITYHRGLQINFAK